MHWTAVMAPCWSSVCCAMMYRSERGYAYARSPTSGHAAMPPESEILVVGVRTTEIKTISDRAVNQRSSRTRTVCRVGGVVVRLAAQWPARYLQFSMGQNVLDHITQGINMDRVSMDGYGEIWMLQRPE